MAGLWGSAGAFALGLAVGGGVVLNLVLWSGHLVENKTEAQGKADKDAQSEQIVYFWHWLLGSSIEPKDTLAQRAIRSHLISEQNAQV